MNLKIIKNIFYIVFILSNYYVYSLVLNIQNQKGCECKTGWKVENLKLISQLAMVLGIINLLIPFNKTLYQIPIISNIFSIGLLAIIFMEIFTLTRFIRNLVNNTKCSETCSVSEYEGFVNMTSDWSVTTVCILTLIITIGLLYL